MIKRQLFLVRQVLLPAVELGRLQLRKALRLLQHFILGVIEHLFRLLDLRADVFA